MLVESFAGEGWANRAASFTLGRSARADGRAPLRSRCRLPEPRGHCRGRPGRQLRRDLARRRRTPTAGSTGISRSPAARPSPRPAARCSVAPASATTPPSWSATPRRTASRRQIWRAVADEQAVTSAAARVEVARDAQKTDGEQSLRGLLMARTATVNLKPELEIFADDVKCAHGATVGELDAGAVLPRLARHPAGGGARAPHSRVRRRRACRSATRRCARLSDAVGWRRMTALSRGAASGDDGAHSPDAHRGAGMGVAVTRRDFATCTFGRPIAAWTA